MKFRACLLLHFIFLPLHNSALCYGLCSDFDISVVFVFGEQCMDIGVSGHHGHRAASRVQKWAQKSERGSA